MKTKRQRERGVLTAADADIEREELRLCSASDR
jgi:hypothetical protein